METFELYLSPIDAKRFKAIVTKSPVGEAEIESSLPFFEGECDWRTTLIRTLETTTFKPEDFPQAPEQDWMVTSGILNETRSDFHAHYLANIGKALYRALFPSSSQLKNKLLEAERVTETKNTQPLHIRLTFQADVMHGSRLADYPWELLHDGKQFLLHRQVTISRYIAHETVPPNLSAVEKVNVLLVSSAAFDLDRGIQPLNKKEQQAISKGLKKASEAGLIRLAELEYATVNELRTYLTEHRGEDAPHVIHFDGHGLFGKRCPNRECQFINQGIKVQQCRKCNTQLLDPQGYLLFEDEESKPDYVSAAKLGTLLRQSSFSDDSNTSSGVALVVLSACQSAMAVAGDSVFNGTAQNLINHRIPAVVAMQYSIGVEAATQFAEQFYRSLGQKDSLAAAISKGREAMGIEGNQWYRPVLYLRWQDNEGGQLFPIPNRYPQPSYQLSPTDVFNRNALLSKVKNFWIKGVLEESLYNQVLINLGLQEKPNLITSPWEMQLQTKSKKTTKLPSDTKVIKLFDQIGEGRTLLIVGMPGSGKTTTLLELARELISRAEANENHRIPVVFNLSSWKGKKNQPIADWLVEELNSKYSIPKKIGQSWVNEQRLLLLLDGLDEVQDEYQNACIAALNQFKKDHALEIVVCSRIHNYKAISNQLNFEKAVFLMPLTLEKVYLYLNKIDSDLTGLKVLIRQDKTLKKLACSPLMLNIMIWAYEGVSIEDLRKIDLIGERSERLFNDYIDRMFNPINRTKLNRRYQEKKTKFRLTWLAQNMLRESQTIFLIEEMQPSWLQSKAEKKIYFLGSALIAGLLGSLTGLVHIPLQPIDNWKYALSTGLLGGVGIIFFYIRDEPEIETTETLQWNWEEIKKNLTKWFLVGLILGLIIGMSCAFLEDYNFIELYRKGIENKVFRTRIDLLSLGLIYAAFITLMIGLMYGSTAEIPPLRVAKTTFPNQGIWTSIRNALITGLANWLISCLIFLLMGLLLQGHEMGLAIKYAVGYGLIGGLIFGIGRSSGRACIKHLTLRFILFKKGFIPWNYAEFLDYNTSKLFLLQKVGGGYIFINRLLLEHFAKMK
ncbi:CHAT domain-containing protein [Nostoc sp. C057]|uniref:CHAT domain-containing protein n=1 Tax=Nostoc sp. C057 TaxID=2576903 RepID=UPI0015C3B793|nr:CHAT domain-containing protein [Nostoc sp. C057]